jgi:hypothetical protein
MHPTPIAQNAASIIRLAAEIAPCLGQQPVHAISLNLKRRNIDRIAVSKEQITCGLAQTHGRQGANDARHHQLHAVESRNRHNNSRASEAGGIRLGTQTSRPIQFPISSGATPNVITRSGIGCNELRKSSIGLGIGS